MLAESERVALVAALEAARLEGLVGPGPVEPHLDHALGFAEATGEPGHAALDLGSGAGIPGLALALVWPQIEWLLLDGRRRSAAFLDRTITLLALDGRVQVVQARAEEAARGNLRGSQDLVVARGVAPPGPTAEYASGFLRVGGRLVVSDRPQDEPGRWDATGLAMLGLGEAARVETSSGAHFLVLTQARPCPDRFPRRTGIPLKRPLF